MTDKTQELKAIAYDLLRNIDIAQMQLKNIVAQINEAEKRVEAHTKPEAVK